MCPFTEQISAVAVSSLLQEWVSQRFFKNRNIPIQRKDALNVLTMIYVCEKYSALLWAVRAAAEL